MKTVRLIQPKRWQSNKRNSQTRKEKWKITWTGKKSTWRSRGKIQSCHGLWDTLPKPGLCLLLGHLLALTSVLLLVTKNYHHLRAVLWLVCNRAGGLFLEGGLTAPSVGRGHRSTDKCGESFISTRWFPPNSSLEIVPFTLTHGLSCWIVAHRMLLTWLWLDNTDHSIFCLFQWDTWMEGNSSLF